MTQSILTLTPATPPASPPVLPAPAAGLLTAANAAAPLPFVDVFRALGLASADADMTAVPPHADAEARAAEASPLDVSLPSQSALPAALRASGVVTEREAETDGVLPGESPALPVVAPALPLALPAQSPQATSVAARSTEVAPVSVTHGTAATPQALLADGPGADVAEAAQSVPPAQGTHQVAPQTAPTATATETVLKLAPAAPQSWQQPLTDALGERLQLQTGQQGERAVIRLDPPMLGRIEIVVHQDAGGALQVHLSASNGEVLRQLHAIGDSLRLDLGQRHAQGDVTVVVADTGRDADGRSRSGQQQQRSDDENPGEALAEAQAGAASSRFALAAEGS